MTTSGRPRSHCPAASSRAKTSRSCPAVTAHSSSSGPSRTTSSGSVHDEAPGPSAATTEYGHPGTRWEAFRPRPCTWQNKRPGLAQASGRSHAVPPPASRPRPPGQAGNGSPASARRSRANPTCPAFSASYNAPCPRENSGTSDSRARSVTRPGPHSPAPPSSNNASARRVNDQYSSSRNPASTPSAAASPAPSSPLPAPHPPTPPGEKTPPPATSPQQVKRQVITPEILRNHESLRSNGTSRKD